MIIQYPCEIKKDEDNFLVTFPNFDEALTEGSTIEEALFNASEVLTLTLEGRLEERQSIPKPTINNESYQHWITPNTTTQAAMLVYFGKGDRTTSDLARILHTSWPSASKLENPKHWPSLRQLDKAASALGKKLVLVMEEI